MDGGPLTSSQDPVLFLSGGPPQLGALIVHLSSRQRVKFRTSCFNFSVPWRWFSQTYKIRFWLYETCDLLDDQMSVIRGPCRLKVQLPEALSAQNGPPFRFWFWTVFCLSCWTQNISSPGTSVRSRETQTHPPPPSSSWRTQGGPRTRQDLSSVQGVRSEDDSQWLLLLLFVPWRKESAVFFPHSWFCLV